MAEEEKRRWRGPKEAVTHDRALAQIPKKKKLKPSSRDWVERQINDPYVRRAQAEGWRSRAAFKLIELDERFHLLKRGSRVIDLGAAPGGWSQVALKQGAARVVGIDLLPVDALAGADFVEGDFLEADIADQVAAMLGARADLVVSDMAANTTGHARTDQIRTGALAEAAAEFALAHLAEGGAFVTKAFQGGLDADVLAQLKRSFVSVRHAKPPASRAESSEVYLVALGFRA